MRICPVTLAQANDLVKLHHRHHAPTVGHRWSIGLEKDGELVGAAICGRPVARMLPQYSLVEVNRLVVIPGIKNGCSMLYGACARIAKEMGFDDIETAILESEPGITLRASGWTLRRTTSGGNWNHSWRKGRRTDQPMCPKQIWGKRLRECNKPDVERKGE